MSWRDKMAPATFRGVPFYVDVSEFSGGRRKVTHEFAFRDDTYTEDTGRKAHAFVVEGHVLGADYLSARDALISALEISGPGLLIHPYYGTRRVQVGDFRVRESADEGGLARFSIPFEETQASPIQPSAAPYSASAITASSDDARSAVYDFFTSQYRVDKAPQWTLTSLASLLQSASGAIYSALVPYISDAQQLAALKQQADGLTADALTLVKTPATMLTTISAYVALIDPLPLTRVALTSLINAYSFAPGTRPPATTATRIQQQLNFDSLQRLWQQTIAIQAARTAPSLSYDSYQDALAVRDSIAALLDEQMETVNDDAYPALQQLRADLVRAVPADLDLPRLVNYTPNTTVPSLVLAHRIYGDVSREGDLLARNAIKHPGIVVGGRTLEVLSDAS